MAIIDTIQAKEFTAGAPNIVLKGDLRPNQMMMASDDYNERALEQIFEQLLEEGFSPKEAAEKAREMFNERSLAYGGRVQYGLGSLVKSIGKGITGAVKSVAKGVKRFAKSDLGKAALLTGLGFGAFGKGPLAFGKFGLPTLEGASLFTGSKAKGTLGAFAIGSLGSAVLSAAEAGGLDTSDPNAEVDLESLTGYLTRGYKNLNPNATDEEVFQFVQENTAEYRADGGRIGYDNGGYTFEQFKKDKFKVDQFMGEEQMKKLYEKMMREKKVREQRNIAAEGGRIGFDDGGDSGIISLIKKAKENPTPESLRELQKIIPDAVTEFKLPGMDQQLFQINEDAIKKFLKGRADAKKGGRIGYAMGDTASENAMQAAGIEGLPLRQNKGGVVELDLRETGGFIQPVGVKEKADDIPAMLSNNEFVFTADAVRAAGGGDIDKGAQLMYDTMKKLESRVV